MKIPTTKPPSDDKLPGFSPQSKLAVMKAIEKSQVKSNTMQLGAYRKRVAAAPSCCTLSGFQDAAACFA